MPAVGRERARATGTQGRRQLTTGIAAPARKLSSEGRGAEAEQPHAESRERGRGHRLGYPQRGVTCGPDRGRWWGRRVCMVQWRVCPRAGHGSGDEASGGLAPVGPGTRRQAAAKPFRGGGGDEMTGQASGQVSGQMTRRVAVAPCASRGGGRMKSRASGQAPHTAGKDWRRAAVRADALSRASPARGQPPSALRPSCTLAHGTRVCCLGSGGGPGV